ncbi:MAG TPA: hypothetical protein ENK26_02850 [Gammaproteobacteria bacterium]|nr:hypothetical protein [Gammaproteobacteria bacterium]
MKKVLLTTAIAVAMGMSFSASADNALNGSVNASGSKTGVFSEGALSPVLLTDKNSYNKEISGSFNPRVDQGFNDVNSDNSVTVGGDANILYANRADQAIATTDLDSTVSGNKVSVTGGFTEGALSPIINGDASTYDTSNTITGSFSGASGIAMVSQNAGHASSIQQSTVVQSNFSLR